MGGFSWRSLAQKEYFWAPLESYWHFLIRFIIQDTMDSYIIYIYITYFGLFRTEHYTPKNGKLAVINMRFRKHAGQASCSQSAACMVICEMSLSAPKHTSYPSAPNIVPFNCFFEGPLIPDPQVWRQLTTHSKSTPKQKKTTSNKNSHSETKKHGAKPEPLIKKERTKHSPLPFRCLAYKLVMQLIQFFWGSVKATWKRGAWLQWGTEKQAAVAVDVISDDSLGAPTTNWIGEELGGEKDWES